MAFQPMPLSRKPVPFDHPEWVFELKYDGFRSLAVIQNGRTELISRNGHPFSSFDILISPTMWNGTNGQLLTTVSRGHCFIELNRSAGRLIPPRCQPLTCRCASPHPFTTNE
jgi:hypothetical protein